jgi:N-acetylglucosamine-6-sulfatase
LGDNGFALGEHGFYDKRDAFEESIRIPMLARHPKLIKPGTRIENMALNVDLAPTILEYARVELPAKPKMDGHSFLSLLQGKKSKKKWREHFVYEYHWEWNFPATPTTFAIRTNNEKYVYYHGVWDRNGFYDLNSDPHERHNLIRVPAYKERILELREKLFNELDQTGGLSIPIRRPKNEQFYDRKLRR